MAKEEGFATKAIHAGQDPLQWMHCSVIPPITLSTTFQQDAPGEHRVRLFILKPQSFSVTIIK